MANESFATRLQQLMEEIGMGPRDLARAADLSESTVYRCLAGDRREPGAGQIVAIARALRVSPNRLLGLEEDADGLPGSEQVADFALVPIMGSVTAGAGGIADEQVEEYRHIPMTFIPQGQERSCFLVEARGESMVDAGIAEGDLLLVCPTVAVHDGDVAVVDVDGEAMVKRVYHQTGSGGRSRRGRVLLVSDNSSYPPRLVDRARIVGRVMKGMRDY